MSRLFVELYLDEVVGKSSACLPFLWMRFLMEPDKVGGRYIYSFSGPRASRPTRMASRTESRKEQLLDEYGFVGVWIS